MQIKCKYIELIKRWCIVKIQPCILCWNSISKNHLHTTEHSKATQVSHCFCVSRLTQTQSIIPQSRAHDIPKIMASHSGLNRSGKRAKCRGLVAKQCCQLTLQGNQRRRWVKHGGWLSFRNIAVIFSQFCIHIQINISLPWRNLWSFGRKNGLLNWSRWKESACSIQMR